jgi:hypothetical protein
MNELVYSPTQFLVADQNIQQTIRTKNGGDQQRIAV